MTWTTALNSQVPLAPPTLPQIVLVAEFKAHSQRPLHAEPTDLLVVPVVEGLRFPLATRALDAATGGAISAAAEKAHFCGKAGEFLLVRDTSATGAGAKSVLLLGLGSHWSYNRFTVCHTTGRMLEVAAEIGARDLTMFVPSHRATRGNVSLSTMAVIMRCRVEAFSLTHGTAALQEIRIFCTPQALPHLRHGLEVKGPRCGVCTLPTLPPTPTHKGQGESQ